MSKIWQFIICAVILHLGAANPVPVPKATGITEFIILHNNDMHARFEQTSASSGKCTDADALSNKCYGGFARVAYEVRKFREEAKQGGKPVLYLNAGDTYTGTTWFAVFKDNITAAFLNKLQPDAISLGNHEFDEKVEGLVPFLNNVEFPVLACNLDLSKTPELLATKHLANSTVLNVNGVKVGVIGYLTPETKTLTAPSSVEFNPEIESINAEAAKMKAEGINIIIALGHSGYQMDMNIGLNCPDVDIVIGGHTNTFLYNGAQPDEERIDGPYPTTVTQSSGKKVPVVQAYAYTKYLGKLHVQFDNAGNLIEFDGTPILLNASIPREPDVMQLLEVYRPNITALENDVVGHTKVYLEGNSRVCRFEECNLGNMIADAMIFARVMENEGGIYWTDAPIALLQGGGIRMSIDKRSDGSITGSDISSVLPFKNDLYITKISGKMLKNALEHSAAVRDQDSNGGFLQMSGIKVSYNQNLDEGHRVTSAEVRCSECNVPDYEPLDETKIYSVIVSEFLLNGGDGHVFLDEANPQKLLIKLNDQDALRLYLQERQFIYPEIEERITVVAKITDEDGDGGVGNVAASIVVVVLSSILLRIFH